MRWLVPLLALALALPAAAKERADRFSAMTYNIRLDLASDGDNAWPHRRGAVTNLVGYYSPDLIGMQEVLLHQKQAIEADLPRYIFVGVARDDGKEQGEFSPLGFRRDRAPSGCRPLPTRRAGAGTPPCRASQAGPG